MVVLVTVRCGRARHDGASAARPAAASGEPTYLTTPRHEPPSLRPLPYRSVTRGQALHELTLLCERVRMRLLPHLDQFPLLREGMVPWCLG